MMYPFNFFLGIFCVMCFGIFSTLFIWVLTQRFPSIAGWNFHEVLFNASFSMFSYSLGLVFFIQFLNMDETVRRGEFDRMLVRPINPLLQFACTNLNINSFGTVGYSFAVLIYSGIHVRDWDILSLLIAAVLIICGFLTSSAIHLIIASTAFFTLQSAGLFALKEVIYNNVSDYPLTIFTKGTQYFLTFIIPIGFIGFYPSSYLLAEGKKTLVGEWALVVCPTVALLLVSLGYFIWSKGIRQYSSSGH